MHSRKTLKLDPQKWDLSLNRAGRIALLEGAQATAQNVANECRLFTQDAYFIQDQGIPHFITELGRSYGFSNTALRAFLRRAALKVDDVKEVLSIEITDFDPVSGKLAGDIQISAKEGDNGPLRINI
jgi:hypothetical protein